MTIPPPADHQPQGQPAAIEPGFDVALQSFWEKNRTFVLGGLIAALLIIIGREAWQYFAARHEQTVRTQFARIADRPEQLGSFAAANADHALAGVAFLQLADARYLASDYKGAIENYQKAAKALHQPVLLGRARLGAAMSQLNAGDQAAADSALKAILADASLPNGPRVEAAYHLATLASEADNTTEVGRLVAELNKIDATSVWAQRAAGLLAGKSQL